MSNNSMDEYLEKTARTWGEFGSNLLRAPLASAGHALSAAGSLPNAVVGTPLAAVSNSVNGINNVANRVSNATIGRNIVPKAMQAATSEVNNNINASVGGAWKDVGQGAARALTNNYGDGLKNPYQSAGAAALNKQHAMNPDPVSRGIGQWASTIGNTAAGLATGGIAAKALGAAPAAGNMLNAGRNAVNTVGNAVNSTLKTVGKVPGAGLAGKAVVVGGPAVAMQVGGTEYTLNRSAHAQAAADRAETDSYAQGAQKLSPAYDKWYGGLPAEQRQEIDAVKSDFIHSKANELAHIPPGPKRDAAINEAWLNHASGTYVPQVGAQGAEPTAQTTTAQPAPQATPESVVGQDGTVEGGLAQPEQSPLSPLTSNAVAEAKDLLSKDPNAVKQLAAGTEKQIQDAVADPKIKDEVQKALSGGEIGSNLLNNAVSSLMKLVQDPSQIGPMLQAMSPAEIVGLGLGLTTAAMGVMHLLSGKGGLGSIISTVAGLSLAGGAFGNANGAAPALPHGPSMGSMMEMLGLGAQTKANTQGAIAAGAVQPQTNSPQSAQGVAGGAQSDTKAPGAAGQASQLSPEVAAALAGLDKNDPQYEDKVLSLVRNEPVFKSREADMNKASLLYGKPYDFMGATDQVNAALTGFTGEKDPARLAKLVDAFRRMPKQQPTR